MSRPQSSHNAVPNLGCGYLVCLVMGAAGLGLLYLAQQRVAERRTADAWIAGTFGLVLTLGGLSLVAPMQREVARAKDRVRRQEEKPDEPWTWDPQWTEPGGIPQTARRHAGALKGFAIVALAVSVPMVFAIGPELKKGNQLVWLALVFPGVALAILFAAAREAWRRRKYGVARFVPATVPVPLGGEVAGMVIVTRPVVASGPGRAALDCWLTEVRRSGGKRQQHEASVAHTERTIAPGEWQTSSGESRLLVQVPLRGGQATTSSRAESESPTYEWRLRVETPTPGADFEAEFVLPVFPVAGSENAGAGAAQTLARSPRDRAEVWQAAGVREDPEPGAHGGHALVLPSGQGRGLITTPLVMTIVFGGLAVFLWTTPVPGFFAVFLGLFALLPALVLKSLWSGGGERVWRERADLCVQRGGSVRRVPLAEIVRIETGKNVGIGTQQFYRVIARTRPKREGHFPGRVELASMVRGEEATTEVLRWMEERIGNNLTGRNP